MENKKYALIIGNSEYKDSSLTRLKAPDVDVKSLAEALRDPSIGDFDRVEQLVNQPYAVVSRAISDFYKDKKREDMLLLYFSGHGVQDDNGRLYLAVKDSEKDYLDSTAVGTAFINDKLTECRSRRKILILDCCHSGAWQAGAKGDMVAMTADTFQGYGQVVMTASDKTEFALEGDQVVEDVSLSLFTNYLLEGLKTGKADKRNDNWIDVDEWFDYAREQVISATGKQRPKLWKLNMEGDLRIARNPFPREIKLPPHLLAAINNESPKIRLQAIEPLVALLEGSVPEMAQKAQAELQRMADRDDSLMVRERARAALQGKPALAIPVVEDKPFVTEKTKRLNALYASALTAMQQRRWEEAQRHLRDIEKEMPDYKDIRQLLQQVSREIEQTRATQWAVLYNQAVQAAHESDWREAQRLLRQLESERPGYRDVRQMLSRAEAELQRQQRLEAGYERALRAINIGNWAEARTLLLQIQKENPLYRDVPNLLLQLNQKFSAPPQRSNTGKSLVIGIVIGVILMLCTCMWILSVASGGY